MMGYCAPGPVDDGEEPEREVSLDFLRAQARSAYQAYQATRYDAAGCILPGLIRAVEAAARITGSGSLAACAVRARVYDTTAALLSRVGEPFLAWAAADRAMFAAEQSGDPLLAAVSAWRLSYMITGRKHPHEALDLAMATAAALERRMQALSPERLSVYGARPADPQPGTRPAPELERYDRIRRERQGFPAAQPAPGPGGHEPLEPIAVLADVLSRDGAELSAAQTRRRAAQTRRRNLANADHLAVLHAIWTAETQAARHDRYRELVMGALPPGHRGELSHRARWLLRTLHAAELAGLDPADVIRTAIASRDLAGSRDLAAVLDARIRPRIDPLLPQPQGPWTRRVPELPDPDRHVYLAQIAVMMDDRTRRLGRHATLTSPAWAVSALGPVPRRHPWQRIEPLRSREPAPAGAAEHEQLDPAPDGKRTETAAWIRDLAIQREAFRTEIDERPGLIAPGQDPVRGDLGETLPAWRASDRDAILRPPKLEIIPSARILQLAAEHAAEPDYEAAD